MSILSSFDISFWRDTSREEIQQALDSTQLKDGFATTYFETGECEEKERSIPFMGPILGGLSEGKSIIIQGQLPAPVKRFVLLPFPDPHLRFAVNFMCQNGDIAFHFNPRFNEGRVVVCNTKEKGQWGREERTSNMPFQPSIYFEMTITVNSRGYQVSVNGSHVLEYKHRLPFHFVQNLQITGDISVNCITFPGTNVPPSYSPAASNVFTPTNAPPPYSPSASNVFTPTNVHEMFAQTFFAPPQRSRRRTNPAQGNRGIVLSNPAVPLHVAIPGNFTQSRKITVVGNVPSLANRFHVNLKNSMTGYIALHINPRFKEGALIRNTMVNGLWGSEERHIAAMPLSPNRAFHMEIINLKNNYKVLVNGQVAFNYTHRIPASLVDQLEIAGDVILSSVQY